MTEAELGEMRRPAETPQLSRILEAAEAALERGAFGEAAHLAESLLACNPDSVKQGVQGSSAFDPVSFARALEKAFRDMHRDRTAAASMPAGSRRG